MPKGLSTWTSPSREYVGVCIAVGIRFEWRPRRDEMRYAGFTKRLSPMYIETKGQKQLKGLSP
jgi:hypothetical protein